MGKSLSSNFEQKLLETIKRLAANTGKKVSKKKI